VRVHALEAGGAVQAWFALRERANLTPSGADPLPSGGMRVLYDVEMTLTAEIGRARLPLREVLGLTPGSVLELDRAAGSPADILVNGRLVARGEVVVVDEDYAVRVSEIVPVPENGA
jgi:flagellar motor switch protein FliN/FliY